MGKAKDTSYSYKQAMVDAKNSFVRGATRVRDSVSRKAGRLYEQARDAGRSVTQRMRNAYSSAKHRIMGKGGSRRRKGKGKKRGGTSEDDDRRDMINGIIVGGKRHRGGGQESGEGGR